MVIGSVVFWEGMVVMWDIAVEERVHQRLADEVFFRILDGRYRLGMRFPSILTFAKEAGTSPETVRKAIKILKSEKLLNKTPHGYFITDNKLSVQNYKTAYIAKAEQKYYQSMQKIREDIYEYLTVRRAWHTEHNRPVILDELKTKAAERNIPLPVCLAECLKAAKATSTSEYVVSNRDGEPLSYTQFKRLWQYIVTRTVKERSYYRYEDGKRVKHTVTPVLGEKAAHNGKVVYSLDFEVTPHQLRHTYITNLIHASVDPKTVQYLAGHESSKITMDIYAKVKYNRPDELVRSMSGAFTSWEAV